MTVAQSFSKSFESPKCGPFGDFHKLPRFSSLAGQQTNVQRWLARSRALAFAYARRFEPTMRSCFVLNPKSLLLGQPLFTHTPFEVAPESGQAQVRQKNV